MDFGVIAKGHSIYTRKNLHNRVKKVQLGSYILQNMMLVEILQGQLKMVWLGLLLIELFE